MSKKHFLVLLLILVVSFTLLNAQQTNQNPSNVMPQYKFDVYGTIAVIYPCLQVPGTSFTSYTLSVTLENSTTIECKGMTDGWGRYREKFTIGGTPQFVTLVAMGKSITKPYTAGSGGELELSLTITIGDTTDPITPPHQN